MKCLMSLGAGLSLVLNVGAETLPPGQVDFGAFSPPRDGEFVEVNLSSTLISIAARVVEKQEPEVAQLLNGLQLVSVHVIGVNDQNRSELQSRSQKIRQELANKGWQQVVTVDNDEQKVRIYLKTQNKETVQGLVVIVMDGTKHAVFINVVGDIKPEKLADLGERLNIDPLKKLHGITDKNAEK